MADFNDLSQWNTVRSSAVTGEPDPDGGSGAFAHSEDGAASSTHFLLAPSVVTTEFGQRWRIECTFKASNRTWAGIWQNTNSVSPRSAFNLSTGAKGTAVNDPMAVSISDLGSGFYRASIDVVTADETGKDTLRPLIIIGEADNDYNFSGLSQESIIVYAPDIVQIVSTGLALVRDVTRDVVRDVVQNVAR